MNYNPGPGQYTAESLAHRPGTGQPAISKASRPDLWKSVAGDKSFAPGPGHTSSKSFVDEKKGPSFGGKYKHNVNSNPGPGEYTDDAARFKRGGTAKIGSNARPDLWA